MDKNEIKNDNTADAADGLTPQHCKRKMNKLHCYDWLADIPESHEDTDLVEVQFKNTRKGYYRNSTKIKLEKGDLVAVESTPGHDIGEVTLMGRLVLLQMKKNGVKIDNPDIKRIYRKAKPNDLEKFEEAKAKEHATMIKARKIAEELGLNMKIGDVEYQGDGNKAIFYYIADDRVDFRQLIKVLAENFRVRIEMKQIGARQEAGRIGGIGPCGRQLCCAGWMTNFVSVATSAARYQEISINPQKLAGQCAKLKCCLNFEVDAYVEGIKKLPSREVALETKDNTYYHFKTDIFKRQITYSTSKDFAANVVTLDASRVFEVIALNKRGIRPDSLETESKEEPRKEFEDVVGQDSLTRFDKNKKRNGDKRKKKSGNKNKPGDNNLPKEGNGNAEESSNGNKAHKNRGQNGENRNERNENRNNNRNRNNRSENNDVPKTDSREKNETDHSGEKKNGNRNNGNRNRPRNNQRNSNRPPKDPEAKTDEKKED